LGLGVSLWFHIVSAMELRLKRSPDAAVQGIESREEPNVIRAVQ
jgi:hypothetical protein